MDDYPRMLYRHPATGSADPRAVSVDLQDDTYDTLTVPDQATHEAAAVEGWQATPAEARAASPEPEQTPRKTGPAKAKKA